MNPFAQPALSTGTVCSGLSVASFRKYLAADPKFPSRAECRRNQCPGERKACPDTIQTKAGHAGRRSSWWSTLQFQPPPSFFHFLALLFPVASSSKPSLYLVAPFPLSNETGLGSRLGLANGRPSCASNSCLLNIKLITPRNKRVRTRGSSFSAALKPFKREKFSPASRHKVFYGRRYLK